MDCCKSNLLDSLQTNTYITINMFVNTLCKYVKKIYIEQNALAIELYNFQ